MNVKALQKVHLRLTLFFLYISGEKFCHIVPVISQFKIKGFQVNHKVFVCFWE